jgi:hypothetical protein
MNKTLRKALKIQKPERKVSNRKILRNILKKQLGTNKISEAWEKCQKSKYGEEKALKLKLQSSY